MNGRRLVGAYIKASLPKEAQRGKAVVSAAHQLGTGNTGFRYPPAEPHIRLIVRLGSEAEVNANPKVALLCASKRTPAQSPVGILAKIKAFYFEDEQSEATAALAEPEHAIWDNIVLGAIFADLERLAGGVRCDAR